MFPIKPLVMPVKGTLLLVLALACVIGACTKQDSTEAGNRVLHRIVSDKDTLLSTTFHYDVHKHLVQLIDSNRQGHVSVTNIDYDTAGNLVKFTTLHRYQSNPVDQISTDSLVYQNGRVAKKLTKGNRPGNFFISNTYNYDAAGRLVTDLLGNSNRTDEVYGYTSFMYDANDNIIGVENYHRSSGIMKPVDTVSITYDSHKNPYGGLGLVMYFLRHNYSVAGKGNKTQAVYNQRNLSPFIVEFDYQYHSDGFPKKMVASRKYTRGHIEVSTFYFYYK